MMRKIGLVLWVLLVLAVLVGCQDQPEVERNQEPIEAQPTKEKDMAVDDETRERITWEKDGSEMVLIPAGMFEMGDAMNELENRMKDAQPVHRVELDAFYMDVYEVTVGQYKKFLTETGHSALPDEVTKFSPTDSHPVVGVSWYDAEAYCRWVGKRLPTEAEWEYAARGGLVGKRYPWGGTEPDGRQCNYADKSADATLRQLNKDWTWAEMGVDDGYARCAPVGKYSPNGYGLYDISGNVYEWCSDWYGENYYSNSSSKNPLGPGTGTKRVWRGGGWGFNAAYLRVAYRNCYSPARRYYRIGFRCVSGSDKP